MNCYNKIDGLLLPLVIGAPAIGGIYFGIAGFSFNLERIILPLILISVVGCIAFFGSKIRVNFSNIGLFFLSIWSLQLIIFSFFSDNVSGTFQGAMICLIPTLISIYVSNKYCRITLIDRASYLAFLYLGIGGVFIFLLSGVMSQDLKSLFIGNASNSISVKLTSIEPNIFGSTLCFFLLVNLHRLDGKLSTLLIFGISVISIILSFSKGPYLSLLIGVIIYVVATGVILKPKFISLFIIGSLGVSLFVFLFVDEIYFYVEAYILRSGTLQARSVVNSYAIEGFLKNPIFGNGALQFPYLTGYVTELVGATDVRQVSISQMFIGIAHDSGVLGLILYSMFLFFVLLHAIFNCKGVDRNRRAAYLSGFVALIVASQTTAVYYTATFGLAAGLCCLNSYKNA